MADKKITELPAATLPIATGVKFEAVQGGINVQVDADDMPGSGAAGVTSVTGQNNAVDNTDPANPIVRNGRRTVTGASASVIGDNNGLVIFNSATPFNFTLDSLAQWTTISFQNIGAGAVTFINGAGVTLAGSTVLSGAIGTNYPTAFVVYETPTTPRVAMGGTNGLARVTADVSGATITLDFNSERERMFLGSASFGTAKAVALDNETNGLVFIAFLNLSNVAAVLSFPTDFTMQGSDARWDDTGHTFTPQTTGMHKFSATYNGTDWVMEASNPYY